MSTLKDRLAEARAESGLSQAQLAKAVGAGQSTIASIENGRNKGSSLFLDLARALNVNVEWLMDGTGHKRTSTDSTPQSTATQASWPFPAIPENEVRALPLSQMRVLQEALERAIAEIKGGERVSARPMPGQEVHFEQSTGDLPGTPVPADYDLLTAAERETLHSVIENYITGCLTKRKRPSAVTVETAGDTSVAFEELIGDDTIEQDRQELQKKMGTHQTLDQGRVRAQPAERGRRRTTK
jgi:transcriptional regulator with XRE-family HTH domain